jgi:adenine specific DNA methylase Mod
MLHWKGKSKNHPKDYKFDLSEVYSPSFQEVDTSSNKDENLKLNFSKKPEDVKSSISLQDAFKRYNLLLHGDNLHALQFLKENLHSTIDLIYIDPPFMKNVSFFRQVYLRGVTEEVSYKQKQYSDTWDLDTYLQFLYERFCLLKELLSDTGSIYVHLDEVLSILNLLPILKSLLTRNTRVRMKMGDIG